MRGRSLLAALAGAGLVLLCGGLTLPPAYAQDDPAAEADPNSGGADPADQQTTPDPSRRRRPSLLPRPPAIAAQPSAEAQTVAPADATPSPDATPIVASIRAKLAGSRCRQDGKRAGPRGARGLLRRAQRSGLDDRHGLLERSADRHRRSTARRRLGSFQRGLRSPFRRATFPNSVDEQALAEIKLDLAILKYARYARGGRTVPVQLNKLYGMTPSLRDPKTVLTEIADAPQPSVYLRVAASQACAVRALASGAAQGSRRSRSRSQASQYAEDHRQHGALALDARKSRVAACPAQRPRLHGLCRQGWQSDLPG